MNRLLLVLWVAVSLQGQTISPRVLSGTQIDVPQIRGLAPSAIVDTTDAANISTGILPNARLAAVPNSALSNSSMTVNVGAGLSTTSPSLPLGGAITLALSLPVNAQTSTSYTVSNSDQAKLVTFSSTAPVLVTLPQAGRSAQFTASWSADFQNLGSGTAIITPTGSSINGASSLSLANNQGVRVVSDGSNYQIFALPTTNLAASGPGGVAGLLPAANVSGLSASAIIDTTDATNISSGTLSAGRLPPAITSSTTGNAATATALSRTPAPCSPTQAAIGVDAQGNSLGCFTPMGSSGLQPPVTTNVLLKYASGTTTTSAVAGTDYQAPTYTPSARGSVSRSVSGKLQEYVTVTDFGADPTGYRDSTIAFNTALSSACPVTVRIPSGHYLLTGQVTISCVGTNLIGDGPQVVSLNFNPTATATALLLQNSSSATELAQNRIQGFTLYGEGTAVKTGIDMVDTEEVNIRDVSCSGSSNAAWSDPTHSSRCLYTQGRQGLWIENFVANADLPIEIGHDPRETSNIQIDIDQSSFRNLYLIGNTSKPCVTIDDDVILSQVVFSGMQSYVACSRAFSWVATTNVGISRGLTIKDDPRWEQSTANDYFVYISMPSSGHLYNVKVENWNEGSANGGGNGFYFRNVIGAVIASGNYEDTNTFVNVDSSVIDLWMMNNSVQTGSALPQATITAGAAAGTSPTISVSGNAQGGKISVTTGTSTSTGTLATVTFPNRYLVVPNCVVSPNGTTNGNPLPTLGWIPTSSGLALYTYGVAPAASTAYTINYSCAKLY